MPRRTPGISKYTISTGQTLWQFVADLGDDPVTGQRRQRRKRGFATQAEAADALADLQFAIEAGGAFLDATRLTCAEYFDLWLATLPHAGTRERTISDYRNELRRYVIPHIGNITLQRLTPLHLEELYRLLMERGGRNGRPLTATTVRRVHMVIRKAIGDAERKGVLQRNVARLATKPSVAQLDLEKSAWTPDELSAFLDAAQDHELYPLFRLVALTGIRRGEACGLRWPDVDLIAQIVHVRRTLAVVNGTPRVEPPKSRRSRRVIDIDDQTADILRLHREQQRELAAELGESWQDSDHVFTTVIGTPQHPDNVGKLFAKLVDSLEIKPLRLHGLRHTHATHLLAAGINARVVSERLGHADVGFTLQVYGHVLPGQQREAADAAARLLGS